MHAYEGEKVINTAGRKPEKLEWCQESLSCLDSEKEKRVKTYAVRSDEGEG